MSIADKLTELTTIRGDIRSALTAKGVSASDHDFADFAGDIGSIGTGGLPPEYQAVDWIQGTGDQLLDTGVSGIRACDLMIDAYISNATGNNGNVIVYGVYQQCFILHYVRGYRRAGYFGSDHDFTYNSNDGVQDGEARVFIYGSVCADDGKYTGAGTYSTTIPSGSILLFGERADQSSEHRFHYCKIYDGRNIVRDYQPCYLKSDNTQVGLYDFVTKTFNTGTGTAPFIKGNDI